MNRPLDAEALYDRVWSLRRQGRPLDAFRLASEGLEKARKSPKPQSLARVLCVMGQMERDRGEPARAADCYREAVGLYRGLDDPRGLAYATRHACDLERELGRLDEADGLADEGLALYRALEWPPLDLANMLRVCALVKHDRGDAKATRQLRGKPAHFTHKRGFPRRSRRCAASRAKRTNRCSSFASNPATP